VLRTLTDISVYSSLWLAATAAALCAAATLAIGGVIEPAALALAGAGTLIVYNVDRLRDLERDRDTSPQRTRFVERWRLGLSGLVLAAGVAAAWFAWTLGPGVALLLAPAAALGLAHRRLKHLPYLKGPYIAAAWVTVVLGLPWLLTSAPRNVAWTAALLFCAVLANALASSARDDEAAAARIGRARALGWARSIAAGATWAALLAPEAARHLLPIPGLTWLALLRFRDDERYGLLILDGALFAGAAASCALIASL
jgi:hypothetical protein